jgi:hypothetical protein
VDSAEVVGAPREPVPDFFTLLSWYFSWAQALGWSNVDEQRAERLRRATRIGRPCGPEAFVTASEQALRHPCTAASRAGETLSGGAEVRVTSVLPGAVRRTTEQQIGVRRGLQDEERSARRCSSS